MVRRILILFLLLSLLLTGCGWLDGSYVSVEAHREHRQTPQHTAVTASDYQQLLKALKSLVAAGASSAAINVEDYPGDSLEQGVSAALRYIRYTYPIGAYAVEDLEYEIGTSGGQRAVAVTITYSRSLAELQAIRTLPDMNAAESVIHDALERISTSAVLMVENYTDTDLTQLVEDYASAHPQTVMETPKVTETAYGTGDARLLELIFTYQNSRDDLRQMRTQVEPMFNSAQLYVSGDGEDRMKYSQLYAFLMERFDYKVETSLTPAYSLLRHGVGDSRAFATVYAAMCRSAGLECMTVTGTCNGVPRTWNIVNENGHYYHLDLLHSNALGGYRTAVDNEMGGYVWDYSAYPPCTRAPVPAEETEPLPAATHPEEKTE